MTSTSTGRIKRRQPVLPAVDYSNADRSNFRHGTISPREPLPSSPAWPHGDLTKASFEELVALVPKVWPAGSSHRANVLRRLLKRLAEIPGSTWQQRWDAARNEESFKAAGTRDDGIAYKILLSLRVLRMDLNTMRSMTPREYAELFRLAQNDPQLDRFFNHVLAMRAQRFHQLNAIFDVTCALTVFGIRFADLDPAGLLHYAWECRRLRVGIYRRGTVGRFSGHLAWQALYEMGHFPPDTPPSLNGAGLRGRRTPSELVDQYPINNPAVRQLLIDYVQRRAAELNYSTVSTLARNLVSHFWCRIEQLSPNHNDLHIPDHLYDQWRAEISTTERGRHRIGMEPLLLTVRSFYLDLHTWAAIEPDRWAAWVAPCPIPPADFSGSARRQRRSQERTAQRTRVRQPLLGDLIAEVAERLHRARALLEAATAAAHGTQFHASGRHYTRVFTDSDRRFLKHNQLERVRARDDSGAIINTVRAEHAAFWDWAIVEILRLTGVRIEEMLELTQLSVRRYLRPNGETVGLLVIAPSKSDRERVIPMTGELFAVIAAIIRRHTADGATIPMVSRFDPNERRHSPPLPYLFQHMYGEAPRTYTGGFVLGRLQMRCQDLALTKPDFAGATFTPHDFRRLFATDLVNNGLPIHIGAALLGHLNLETTRGYVAVFEEDLVRHYQEFMHHRRARRPTEEYRPTTPDEWLEFERHFDKRKVELGNCGRPYQTPCAHEHACIRCPMLLVNPAMLDRLDVIEDDLNTRRDRAQDQGWLGEIEGIDLTIGHLQSKRQQAQRLSTTQPHTVLIGLPIKRAT